jgi:hypothetical protein
MHNNKQSPPVQQLAWRSCRDLALPALSGYEDRVALLAAFGGLPVCVIDAAGHLLAGQKWLDWAMANGRSVVLCQVMPTGLAPDELRQRLEQETVHLSNIKNKKSSRRRRR